MTRLRWFHHVARLAGYSLVVSLVWIGIVGCDSQADTPPSPDPANAKTGIWISREEVRALPMSGLAWKAVVEHARLPADAADLSNQDDPSNVRVLAKALYFVRTGEVAFETEVELALEKIQGSESDANALAVSRELIAYVVAAELIGLDGVQRDRFRSWLRGVSLRSFEGRTIRGTHEQRPNNWGTHAGATRIAIAAYLGDERELARAAQVFRTWTGEDPDGSRFEFGAPDWQPRGFLRYAVNPMGAEIEGHSIDGVLPDDQRRSGRFAWPPPKENYVYEALQGAVAQAVMLERLGYDSWSWGDRALLRAFDWLHTHADFPAIGDDTWLPHIVNRAYGTRFPAPIPTQPGKAMGFADWTHSGSGANAK